jgi:hypothetical protein
LTPDALTAVATARTKGHPVEAARQTANHLFFLEAAAAAGPNPDWNDVLAEAQRMRNDLNQRLAGRPPAGDWPDWVANGLYAGDAIAKAAGLIPNPKALVASHVLGNVVGIGQDILKQSWVQDYITGKRSNYTTATQYELIDQFRPLTKSAIDLLAEKSKDPQFAKHSRSMILTLPLRLAIGHRRVSSKVVDPKSSTSTSTTLFATTTQW